MALFVMKGVTPEIKMGEIWLAAIPYILLNLFMILLIYIFPPIALWF
jgi:TRAP-type mannitol/chloroaromatic compound transport system permease large subunit